MTNNNLRKGFALPLVIAIVALVMIGAGMRTRDAQAALTPQGEIADMKKDTSAEMKRLQQKMSLKKKALKQELKMKKKIIKKESQMKKTEGATMIKPDGTTVKSAGTMVKPTSTNMEKTADGAPATSGVEWRMAKYTGTVLAGKSAPLLDFTQADYDAAVKSDKLVILYFYANWCPICTAEVANALIPAFNELTTDTVVGIRVNYKDSDTDKAEENLARQYGIPYQHTKVFVKNGKQVLKAPDGWNKARYLTEINTALAQ